MRLLILIIGSLLLAIAITSISINYNGLITLTLSDWIIQTSFTLFIILISAIFLILYFAINILGNILGAKDRFNKWKKNHNQQLSEKYLLQGLQALFEGNWQLAEKQLKKGIPYSNEPLVNCLGAARAAQYQGALDRRDNYLKLASKSDYGHENLAIDLLQAEKQLDQQQSRTALTTLISLNDRYPDNIQVKAMLLEAYINQKDWPAVLSMISELKNNKSLSEEKIKSLKLRAYSGQMQNSGKAGNKDRLEEIWNSIPRQLRNEAYLVESYTIEKLKLSDSVNCEPLIRNYLKKQWDEGLIKLYGLVEGNDISRQLKFAEQMLVTHPDDPILLLTLGRLCVRNSLWGKARGYFEDSIELKPLPETYRDLAALLDKQGEHMAANVYYQKGLTLATSQDMHKSVQFLQHPEDQNSVCNVARQIV